VLTVLVAALAILSADADEIKPIPRRLPPEGMAVPPSIQNELGEAAEALRTRFERLRPTTHRDYRQDAGDVLIFVKAVDFALRFREFYSEKDFSTARQLLAEGNRRCDALAKNERPWTKQKGRVVRGYLSTLDDSPQPFGLEIPEEIDLSESAKKVPLYVWLHGRGDKQTDLHFIQERMTRPGQIAPQGAIVVHPFGRHCLGFKSAGEADVMEVSLYTTLVYPADHRKTVLIGFSMGGAGAWHLGAHYAGRWAAIAPGAGFADTQRYQKLDAERVPWYERTLWGQYDAPPYARNLLDKPVIAYSGELDPQKQAADVMAEAFASQGAKLKHVIGPGMKHQYDPTSLREILQFSAEACALGRPDTPRNIHLQTQTLRYSGGFYTPVILEGLEQHWHDSRLDAELDGQDTLRITTKNVTAFVLNRPFFQEGRKCVIDGDTLTLSVINVRSGCYLLRTGGRWATGDPVRYGKTRGCQGPIDDAFRNRFLVVRPTGKCRSAALQRWIDFELAHLLDRWRATFRGEPLVKNDTDITPEDLSSDVNLILWGDEQANRVIAGLNAKLPIRWDGDQVVVGSKSFPAAGHVPVFIHPKPLPPKEGGTRGYLVLNSGPTFREAHDATNSQQNPKLPDWAIVDLSQPPDDKSPGKIVAADFFDEEWKLKPPRPQGP
jgi:predicted esterase